MLNELKYLNTAQKWVLLNTATLQAGMSRVRLPITSLDFSIDLILPIAL
jgi:hypothetical protein